ncbi:hypothetical protein WJX84_011781 [Apatococcus fuscideae]|uniref:Uncharacterized protein n=1 Tax=Apatococcus fuscideae TaxID=2026836 RepID=A0AAW1RS41_9CHLO
MADKVPDSQPRSPRADVVDLTNLSQPDSGATGDIPMNFTKPKAGLYVDLPSDPKDGAISAGYSNANDVLSDLMQHADYTNTGDERQHDLSPWLREAGYLPSLVSPLHTLPQRFNAVKATVVAQSLQLGPRPQAAYKFAINLALAMLAQGSRLSLPNTSDKALSVVSSKESSAANTGTQAPLYP